MEIVEAFHKVSIYRKRIKIHNSYLRKWCQHYYSLPCGRLVQDADGQCCGELSLQEFLLWGAFTANPSPPSRLLSFPHTRNFIHSLNRSEILPVTLDMRYLFLVSCNWDILGRGRAPPIKKDIVQESIIGSRWTFLENTFETPEDKSHFSHGGKNFEKRKMEWWNGILRSVAVTILRVWEDDEIVFLHSSNS